MDGAVSREAKQWRAAAADVRQVGGGGGGDGGGGSYRSFPANDLLPVDHFSRSSRRITTVGEGIDDEKLSRSRRLRQQRRSSVHGGADKTIGGGHVAKAESIVSPKWRFDLNRSTSDNDDLTDSGKSGVKNAKKSQVAVESAACLRGDPGKVVLSPPRNMGRSPAAAAANLRSVSVTDSLQERSSGLKHHRRRSVTGISEALRHLDFVVDDDIIQLNALLRRMRGVIERISDVRVIDKVKIVLSRTTTSSMVAAIGYTWLSKEKERRGGRAEGAVVPVMNVRRQSMHKHRQAAWLFHYLGIDASSLLFADEIDVEGMATGRKAILLFVGKEILDTKNEVGSACTLLTEKLYEGAYDLSQAPNLRTILLAGILLDTNNLDNSSKFLTNRDRKATQMLLGSSSSISRHELFENLTQDHMDSLFLATLHHKYGSPRTNKGNRKSVDEASASRRRLMRRTSSQSSIQNSDDPKSSSALASAVFPAARLSPWGNETIGYCDVKSFIAKLLGFQSI